MKYQKIGLILILLLGLSLRIYSLGKLPISLNWDEAVYGYNSFSLLKTGRDEYGTSWPKHIMSKNNFMQSGYAYLAEIPIALGGLNEFTIRLPAAVFGTATILLSFLVSKEMFKSKWLSLISASLVAVNPWHVQASRLGLPFTTAVFLLALLVYLLLLSIKRPWLLTAAALVAGAGFYVYNSVVVMAPLLVLGFGLIYFKKLIQHWKWAGVSLVIFIVMVLPVITDSGATQRFSSINILDPRYNTNFFKAATSRLTDIQRGNVISGGVFHNQGLITGIEYLKNYFKYWNGNFLFLDTSDQRMFYNSNIGLFYIWELPLMIVGIYSMLKKRKRQHLFSLWWLVAAPAPAAFALGAPIAWRGLTFIPIASMLAAYGAYHIFYKVNKFRPKILMPALGASLLIMAISVTYFWHQYSVHSPIEFAAGWREGMKEMAQFVDVNQNKYDKIIVTTANKLPYIYIMFYNQLDPDKLQKTNERHYKRLGKYEFRKIDWLEDRKLKNTLILGTDTEIPREAPGFIKSIIRGDSSVAFRIVKTQK